MLMHHLVEISLGVFMLEWMPSLVPAADATLISRVMLMLVQQSPLDRLVLPFFPLDHIHEHLRTIGKDALPSDTQYGVLDDFLLSPRMQMWVRTGYRVVFVYFVIVVRAVVGAALAAFTLAHHLPREYVIFASIVYAFFLFVSWELYVMMYQRGFGTRRRLSGKEPTLAPIPADSSGSPPSVPPEVSGPAALAPQTLLRQASQSILVALTTPSRAFDAPDAFALCEVDDERPQSAHERRRFVAHT
jgi:hypothetical protein